MLAAPMQSARDLLQGSKRDGVMRLLCCMSQAIAIGQRAMRGRDPEAVMADLGFGPLQLIDSFSVSMAGVGTSPSPSLSAFLEAHADCLLECQGFCITGAYLGAQAAARVSRPTCSSGGASCRRRSAARQLPSRTRRLGWGPAPRLSRRGCWSWGAARRTALPQRLMPRSHRPGAASNSCPPAVVDPPVPSLEDDHS